jgi:hypothetical protein
MSNTIYLDPKMVPAALRGAYSGQKFKAVVCTETSIPADAGLWSGGTREVYDAIDMATGKTAAIPGQQSSPWNSARREVTVPIKPGYALVKHSWFCGTDMGLTFYVHPDNAVKLLPAPSAELTPDEKIVLQATCSFKSSYNGMDRYEMMKREASSLTSLPFPTRDEWNAAKQSLIAKGLLNKAGAVTPAGRNARPPRY